MTLENEKRDLFDRNRAISVLMNNYSYFFRRTLRDLLIENETLQLNSLKIFLKFRGLSIFIAGVSNSLRSDANVWLEC